MTTLLPSIQVQDPGTKENYDVPQSFFTLSSPTDVSFFVLSSQYAPPPGAPAVFEGTWISVADVTPGNAFEGQFTTGKQVTRTNNIWSFPKTGVWRITNFCTAANSVADDNNSNLWMDFDEGDGFAGTSTSREFTIQIAQSVGISVIHNQYSFDAQVVDIETNFYRWFFSIGNENTAFSSLNNSVLFERLRDLP